jgi:hypothetical protein
VRPDILVVIGGPEVSYEYEGQAIFELADYLITGEADLAFARLCSQLLSGEPPAEKVISAPLPDLETITLPYRFYSDTDLAHRVTYVEASRGCPFSCEFCLSSLDIPVRLFEWEALARELDDLLRRGARQLKFVDRTFNLNVAASLAVLEFCLERCDPGRLFHFEMIPDRLPEPLREVISRFPPGALQLEVGVQSFNESVCERISRRQDVSRLEDNFRFLRERTGAHVHADLIVGLPGETLESLAAGFDRLVALGPQEIQVGMLKRLRGTPISRHDAEWGMRYSPEPPYEVLQNKLIDFATMQRLRRFARYWDLMGNSGNFVETTPLLWRDGASPFAAFLRWSDWLYARVGRTDSIALVRLSGFVFEYLTSELRQDQKATATVLWRDYQRGGRTEQPGFLQPYLPANKPSTAGRLEGGSLKRQQRHLRTGGVA